MPLHRSHTGHTSIIHDFDPFAELDEQRDIPSAFTGSPATPVSPIKIPLFKRHSSRFSDFISSPFSRMSTGTTSSPGPGMPGFDPSGVARMSIVSEMSPTPTPELESASEMKKDSSDDANPTVGAAPRSASSSTSDMFPAPPFFDDPSDTDDSDGGRSTNRAMPGGPGHPLGSRGTPVVDSPLAQADASTPRSSNVALVHEPPQRRSRDQNSSNATDEKDRSSSNFDAPARSPVMMKTGSNTTNEDSEHVSGGRLSGARPKSGGLGSGDHSSSDSQRHSPQTASFTPSDDTGSARGSTGAGVSPRSAFDQQTDAMPGNLPSDQARDGGARNSSTLNDPQRTSSNVPAAAATSRADDDDPFAMGASPNAAATGRSVMDEDPFAIGESPNATKRRAVMEEDPFALGANPNAATGRSVMDEDPFAVGESPNAAAAATGRSVMDEDPFALGASPNGANARSVMDDDPFAVSRTYVDPSHQSYLAANDADDEDEDDFFALGRRRNSNSRSVRSMARTTMQGIDAHVPARRTRGLSTAKTTFEGVEASEGEYYSDGSEMTAYSGSEYSDAEAEALERRRRRRMSMIRRSTRKRRQSRARPRVNKAMFVEEKVAKPAADVEAADAANKEAEVEVEELVVGGGRDRARTVAVRLSDLVVSDDEEEGGGDDADSQKPSEV